MKVWLCITQNITYSLDDFTCSESRGNLVNTLLSDNFNKHDKRLSEISYINLKLGNYPPQKIRWRDCP